jgi:hypothetical protein
VSARLPISARVGLIASVGAIGFWIVEQLTGLVAFEFLTIPFKLVLLATPLFLLSDLSSLLRGRPQLTIGLGVVLGSMTLGAMLAYLPWRDTFAHHFNNDVYRWYYGDTNPKSFGAESEFTAWQKSWAHHVPHRIEATLLVAYYGLLLTACSAFRLNRVGSAIVAVIGYAALFIVPLATGLIVWDYDTFLRGIAFDSISMDLVPVGIWFAGDYSIFLYTFMFIFFGVCSMFFWTKSQVRSDLASCSS